MKKIIFILLAVLLVSCSKAMEGYVVYKEYTPGHMCHDDDIRREIESNLGTIIVVPPHVPHTAHSHKWEDPTWIIWVATKGKSEELSVDSLTYISFKCGDKVYVDSKGGIKKRQ